MSMNQGKLEVVKQETARVNVDILGIRKLKWTGMGEFNSDDHYIYYCGQESLRSAGSGSKELTLGAALIDSQGSVHGHSSLSRHPSGIYYPS